MAAQARSRLTNVFDKNASASNDSLRYTAPKQSSMQSTTRPTTAPVAAPVAAPATILHSAKVHLYQYQPSSRSWLPMGGGAFIGCILHGSGTNYRLHCYDTAKNTLCSSTISATFKCTIQLKGFVNFYEENASKNNWSLKFENQEKAQAFMKDLACIIVHVGIWTPHTTWTGGANPVGMTDIITVDNNDVIAVGDTVAVEFSIWRIVGNANVNPKEVMASAPFEVATESALRKIRIGEKKERFQALELGVVGMKKGSARIFVSPPALSNEWYLIQVQVIKMKSSKSNSKSPVLAAQTEVKPTAVQTSSSVQSSQPIVPYSPLPGSPQASKHREVELQRQLEEMALEKKVLLESQKMEQLKAAVVSPFASPSQTPTSSIGVSSNSNDTRLDQILHLLQNRSGGASSLLANSVTSSSTAIAVSAVVRATERLGSENERVLLDLTEAHHHIQELESRQEKLSVHSNQVLQENRNLVTDNRNLVAQMEHGNRGWKAQSDEVAKLLSEKEAALSHAKRVEEELSVIRQEWNSTHVQFQSSQGAERERHVRIEQELHAEKQARMQAEQQLQLRENQMNNDAQLFRVQIESQAHAEVKGLQDRISQLTAFSDSAQHKIAELSSYPSQVQEAQNREAQAVENLTSKTREVHDLRQQVFTLQNTMQGLSQKEDCSSETLEKVRLQVKEEMKVWKKEEEDKLQKVREGLDAQKVQLDQQALDQQTSNVEVKSSETTTSPEPKSEAVRDLFKNTMNDVYTQFQDTLDNENDERYFSITDVLDLVKKVLKTSSKKALVKITKENDATKERSKEHSEI